MESLFVEVNWPPGGSEKFRLALWEGVCIAELMNSELRLSWANKEVNNNYLQKFSLPTVLCCFSHLLIHLLNILIVLGQLRSKKKASNKLFDPKLEGLECRTSQDCLPFSRAFWEKRRQFPKQIPSEEIQAWRGFAGSGFPLLNPGGDNNHQTVTGLRNKTSTEPQLTHRITIHRGFLFYLSKYLTVTYMNHPGYRKTRRGRREERKYILWHSLS